MGQMSIQYGSSPTGSNNARSRQVCFVLNINAFSVYAKATSACVEFLVRGPDGRGAASGKNSTEIVSVAAAADGRLRSLTEAPKVSRPTVATRRQKPTHWNRRHLVYAVMGRDMVVDCRSQSCRATEDLDGGGDDIL